jgi:hypothetical protein
MNSRERTPRNSTADEIDREWTPIDTNRSGDKPNIQSFVSRQILRDTDPKTPIPFFEIFAFFCGYLFVSFRGCSRSAVLFS